jgi:hypothetical protein
MSKLGDLVDKFTISLEKKDERFGEDELKFRLAEVIEYLYYFSPKVKKSEMIEIVNELKG